MTSFFSRRRCIGAVCAGLATGILAGSSLAQTPPVQRLNVLLITADDLGTQLGCYGDPLARTPNLDALAKQGVQFQNGYITAPSCSPSRSSILTGLYPHQNEHWGLANFNYRMHEGIPTMPGLLRRAGYYNAIIGKLHVNPASAFPFDFARTDATKTWDVKWVAQTAREQMQAAQGQSKPFFLYVNYFDPHTPFHDQFEGVPANPHTPAQMRPFPFHPVDALNKGVREQMAGYYNGIARLDVGIGLLLDELKKSGRDRDTLVIFVGDHGPQFPRGKNAVYEAGIRVPYLVLWPGATTPHRDDRLVSAIDFLPTVLDAAGVKLPAPLPGASLRPLLTGKEAPWRQVLGAENNSHGSRDWYPQRSLRDGRWKLIHTLLPDRLNPKITPSGGEPWIDLTKSPPKGSLGAQVFATHRNAPQWQLYDLQNDPQEFRNLAGKPEHAAIETRLRAQLEAWRRDCMARFTLLPSWCRSGRRCPHHALW
jgi:N-sulfoglucosamine sulfohydrolase